MVIGHAQPTISRCQVYTSSEKFIVKTTLAVNSIEFCQAHLMKTILAKAWAVDILQSDAMVMG